MDVFRLSSSCPKYLGNYVIWLQNKILTFVTFVKWLLVIIILMLCARALSFNAAHLQTCCFNTEKKRFYFKSSKVCFILKFSTGWFFLMLTYLTPAGGVSTLTITLQTSANLWILLNVRGDSCVFMFVLLSCQKATLRFNKCMIFVFIVKSLPIEWQPWGCQSKHMELESF